MEFSNYRLCVDPLLKLRFPDYEIKSKFRKPVLGFILIIEKDPFLKIEMQEKLVALGYRVAATSSVKQASRFIHKNPNIELIISDIHLGSTASFKGYDFFLKWRKIRPQMRFILTSPSLLCKYVTGYKPGHTEFLLKPIDNTDWLGKVKRLIGSPCYSD